EPSRTVRSCPLSSISPRLSMPLGSRPSVNMLLIVRERPTLRAERVAFGQNALQLGVVFVDVVEEPKPTVRPHDGCRVVDHYGDLPRQIHSPRIGAVHRLLDLLARPRAGIAQNPGGEGGGILEANATVTEIASAP